MGEKRLTLLEIPSIKTLVFVAENAASLGATEVDADFCQTPPTTQSPIANVLDERMISLLAVPEPIDNSAALREPSGARFPVVTVAEPDLAAQVVTSWAAKFANLADVGAKALREESC
jgi:hypothetical protein